MGILLCLLPVLTLAYRTEAGVYELTTSDVDTWHEEFKDYLRMIQMYAPFEHKSKEFSPVYIDLWREVQRLGLKVALGKVDVAQYKNKPLIGQYHSGGFPHLVFFRAGGIDFSQYEGEKTVPEMLNFLKRHLFNITKVTEIEQYDRIVDEYPLQGMLFAVVQSNSSQLAEVFTEYAKVNSGKFAFGMAEDKGEFAARFDLEGDAIVVTRPTALLGKNDIAVKTITKAASVKELHSAIQKTYLLSINLFTKYTEDILKSTKRPLVVLYFNIDASSNLPHIRYMTNRFRRAVEDFFMYDEEATRFTFAIADRREYLRELEVRHLYTSNVLLTIYKDGKLYALQENKLMLDNNRMRKEAVDAFLREYLDGKLEPYVQSQDLPIDDYDHNVRVVVGLNFKKVVLNALKHVVLLVYSKAYLEIQQTKPEVHEAFAKLGELLRDSDTILVAKVEIDLNEIPGDYTAFEYPKVFFIPENEKYRPEIFPSDAIEYDSLVKWVSDNVDKRKPKSQKEL